MNVVAIVQARMASTRFPGKVLEPLDRFPLLWHVVQRARRIPGVQQTMVATVRSDANLPIRDAAKAHLLPYWAGLIAEPDVLGRLALVAKWCHAEVVVRVTADCPMLDPWVAGRVLAPVVAGDADYSSNVWPARTYPDGLDVEAFRFWALEEADRCVHRADLREHVGPAVRQTIMAHRVANRRTWPAYRKIRWTVDTPADLVHVRRVWRIARQLDGDWFRWRAALVAEWAVRLRDLARRSV